MRLILAGCEYSGTTTLAHAIDDWMADTMGARFSLIHEHYKVPHTSGHPDDTTPEERKQILALSPKLKEMTQRHSLYYHVQPGSFDGPDWMVIGLHIEDAVYGPIYFGYGGDGDRHDRKVVSMQVERAIMRFATDVVLVHVKASPDVIVRRMREKPHDGGVIKESDVPRILRLFDEGCARSTLRNKMTLDTSSASLAQTVVEFASNVERFLTDTDRLRILTHRALKAK
ncbi:MAG: hypothetical protein HYY34_06695 [Chloroflexi bacterium]|nr:hypothetical protein [Chloroflexota bacterium]